MNRPPSHAAGKTAGHTRPARLIALAAVGFCALLFWTARAARAEGEFNACGCRQTAQGMCICEKRSHCGCPGECEPNGCEERRSKQLEKEIQAETKKAEEAARKQNQAQSQSQEQLRKGRLEDEASEEEPAAKASTAKSTATPPGTKGGTKSETKTETRSGTRNGSKLTAMQKKELGRLLGLYLSEHPNEGARTVDEVRAQIEAGAGFTSPGK